ncbi:hypothetical protein [Actinopolymorpha alba]|uniref:hypothetical protein n=1 Tax=Actinopolymorpha alba TaxID=533267 RepID=UPI0003761977|nr:hypothetical protein [Actinopolymorpha alba]
MINADCVRPVFEFGSDPFWRQVHGIREGILAEAARARRAMISTTIYSRWRPHCFSRARGLSAL